MSDCIHDSGLLGGIDLGGTKIESKLFDARLNETVSRRRKTPRDYNALLAALVEETGWLRAQAGAPDLGIGIGVPGIVAAQTGKCLTSNIPATGRTLHADVRMQAGGLIRIANDCKCFALSEAVGGAGAGYNSVFGLIIGTGLGGGFCRNGQLSSGLNGVAGEVGHFGLPAHLVHAYDLPVLPCGCGRRGCYETLVSGRGIQALARHRTGTEKTAGEIFSRARAGEAAFCQIVQIWLALTAELVHTLQLTLDPDCIVLGGGLSKVENMARQLEGALEGLLLSGMQKPAILAPRFGDSSGSRGAALLVKQKATET